MSMSYLDVSRSENLRIWDLYQELLEEYATDRGYFEDILQYLESYHITIKELHREFAEAFEELIDAINEDEISECLVEMDNAINYMEADMVSLPGEILRSYGHGTRYIDLFTKRLAVINLENELNECDTGTR